MERILRKNWLIALAALMISCFVFTACGSDDKDDKDVPDEPSTSETSSYAKLIVGTWEDDDDDEYRMVFSSNGSGYDMFYEKGSWDVDEEYNWKIQGNSLIITWEDGEKMTCTIQTLDKQHLVLSYSDEGEYGMMSMTKVK